MLLWFCQLQYLSPSQCKPVQSLILLQWLLFMAFPHWLSRSALTGYWVYIFPYGSSIKKYFLNILNFNFTQVFTASFEKISYFIPLNHKWHNSTLYVHQHYSKWHKIWGSVSKYFKLSKFALESFRKFFWIKLFIL
jgi:hypothetical protein